MNIYTTTATVDYVGAGVKNYKKTKTVNKLTLKVDPKVIDEIGKIAFADSPEKLTPKWYKENNGTMYLSSDFEVRCVDSRNVSIPMSEVYQGAEIKIALNVKDGAVYPHALMVITNGTPYDPFALFGESDGFIATESTDTELPFK